MVEIYTEPLSNSEGSRQIYANSVLNATRALQYYAQKLRKEDVTPKRLAQNREHYRKDYIKMLGIDMLKEVFGTQLPDCKSTVVGEDSLCKIQRLQLEIAPNVYFTGLLLTPHTVNNNNPLCIMAHGGGGSPELCCDIVGQNNYGGTVRRVLSKGITVFAPQLLLWDLNPKLCESEVPEYTAQYDRHTTSCKLIQCGTSIAAFEIYCISRSLDYLLSINKYNENYCGMMGLSYGGFYTLYTMAYDTRIKCGWSAAFFNDRTKYCWHDMIWFGSAQKFLDQEVAGLCAPRRLICDVGKQDTVFDASGVTNLFGEVEEFFAASNARDNLLLNLWDGGHRFCKDSFDYFIKELIN